MRNLLSAIPASMWMKLIPDDAMTTFTEKPSISIREMIYLISVAVAIGISYAAQKYNTDVIKQEMQRATQITSIYVEQLQESNMIQDKRLEALELSLRKMELDVARYLNKR